MAGKAILLKDEGNRYFRDGDFKEAEKKYTFAIQKDSSDPRLFTNRAMARIKLQLWDACIDDCIKSIELERANMKGYYYLAQAQLALHHPNEALSSALTAYSEALNTNSPSTRNVSALVLQAKKEKWEAKERDRMRRQNALLRELEDGLQKTAEQELLALRSLAQSGDFDERECMEEKEEIESSLKKKKEDLRNVFAIADPKNMQKREVPDYMIDNISFAIMHDPVLTKTGQSYDRSTMLEHLRRSETDPLTREPLRAHDLRPNLALKQACEEFLEDNGWAVDW